MAVEKDEKTEPATQKRREDSRKKGQVAKSREVTSVAVLMAGIVYFYFFSSYLANQLQEMALFFFQGAGQREIGPDDLFIIGMHAIQSIGLVVMPLVGLVAFFAVAAHVLQFGLLFAPEAAMPKFNKLNPLEGVKRITGKQGWMDLFKSLAKVALVTYVCVVTIGDAWGFLPELTQLSPAEILSKFWDIALTIAIRSAAILVILAALDYAFQRYEYENNLKMTKEEVKQEYKQREGDPLVKMRIRQVQREISRRRMMSEVPKADVIITNPTHYAIAILYDRIEMEAPTVIAKGKGFIALRIKEIAEEHDVPKVEDKLLAQGLYKNVPLGGVVPLDFYKAVAEVLAYVYKLKKKVA